MSRFRVIASSLNVRKGPNTDTSIVTKLPRNTIVEPIDLSPAEDWYMIDMPLNGERAQGWIFKDFLVPLEAEPTVSDDPRWLEIAENEMGTSEVPGSGDNPRILKYHQATTLKATDDSVAWCSAFANFCMKEAGIQGSGSAAARSWLNWGTRLDQPRNGCVVVLQRGGNPTQGHVGFYVGDGNGRIRILGGNQSDQVKISLFPKAMLLGFRWPANL